MPKLIFTLPDRQEQKYALYLDRERTTIGRSADNKIILDDQSVSTRHARIDRIKGGFELIDLDSTNGVRENNVMYSQARLKPGAVYRVGDVVLTCQFSPAELVELAKEEIDI